MAQISDFLYMLKSCCFEKLFFILNLPYSTLGKRDIALIFLHLTSRGGVEDTRLEAKAKDTKKSEAKDRNAQGQGHKCKCFPKKKGLKNLFQSISTKNSLEKHFSANLQNFNHSNSSAVLEPRTGQFLRT